MQRIAAAPAEWRRQRLNRAPAADTDGSTRWSGERRAAGDARRRVDDGEQRVERCPHASGRSGSAVCRCENRSGIHVLGVAPQALETVERARFGREDVDDEIEVIEQNPLGAVVAFDLRRFDV